MFNRIDWKFLIPLLATVAGAVIPLWLWQSDQSSRSLTLTRVSTTDLRPTGASGLDGFRMTFEGQELEEPFLSVLELVNSGTRPISQSEYESKIEISTQSPAKIVKVQVASVDPHDLRPVVAVASGVISIEPLLLNPSDKIRISTLTTSGKPAFSIRSRIAGIPSIELSDQLGESRETRQFWVRRITGMLLFVVYIVNFFEVFLAFRTKSFRLKEFVTAIICCLGGIIMLETLSAPTELTLRELFLYFAVAGVISLPFIVPQLMRSLRSSG